MDPVKPQQQAIFESALSGNYRIHAMMEYKGYMGKITTVDEKQGLLHGEVVGISDVVTFHGKTATEVAQAFRDSVDDYLAFCEEEQEPTEKPVFREAPAPDPG